MRLSCVLCKQVEITLYVFMKKCLKYFYILPTWLMGINSVPGKTWSKLLRFFFCVGLLHKLLSMTLSVHHNAGDTHVPWNPDSDRLQ